MPLRRQSHVVVFVHLVWATWDRLPLLTPEVERVAHRAVSAKCGELGVQVVALGGVDDHMHLLVRLPATLSVADLAKHAKGASSHLVTHRLSAGQDFKWQGSYAAFSVSPRQLGQVREYVARQREHHAAESLIADWELPPRDEQTSTPSASPNGTSATRSPRA